MFQYGSGGGNRTPTNGFGDRRTAIILRRSCLVDNQGVEPRIPKVTDLQSAAVANAARCPCLAHRTGFEPVIYAVKGRCPRPLDERCVVFCLINQYIIL